jgi:glyoxylase-like metal-dependent hydrolase (beta-lactamase superfamily II)
VPETTLSKISEHVYWLSPGAPDRPALGAVVGTQHTLLLDGGASPAHVRLFLDALHAEGVPPPRYLALTHWHWDHVFGAAEMGVPMIAHEATAEQLAILAGYKWDNAAIDERLARGEEIEMCAADIKVELPEPRTVTIAPPEIVFSDSLEFRLGEVTCHVQHVGGDHAGDSCVMHIMPDRVLFLSDCLYNAIYTPTPHYTVGRLFPLLNTVLGFEAEQYVEGHTDAILSRADMEARAERMRFAGRLVERVGGDEREVLSAAQAQAGPLWNEDTEHFLHMFLAGRRLT